MNNKMTIGEMAKLMGTSIDTLRYYSKCGLVEPSEIDGSSKYRYYDFSNIHTIDKIMFLRQIGIKLADIEAAFNDETSETIIHVLEKRREELIEEEERLRKMQLYQEWFFNYFNHSRNAIKFRYPYIKTSPDRYAFGISCGDKDVEEEERFLYRIKHSPESKRVHFLRQFGYVVDPVSTKENKLRYKSHYVNLVDKPEETPIIENTKLLYFPKGDYLCIMVESLDNEWMDKTRKAFFENVTDESLIILDEYGIGLKTYGKSVYEIQIFLK